jgi:N-acetylated-alpha-linked acidic dipeptidase
VEEHADELSRKAVAYLNSDSNGRGYLHMAGSHSLEKFINGVARDIEDPEKKITVWKRDQLRRIEQASSPEGRQEARERPDLRIGALGSGSDYGAFVDHLGIASLDLGYGGEDGGGVYHSIYDDFYWYTHFSDTTFVYGRTLAQTAGTAVMRLADAELLPFDFSNFADTIHLYTDDLKKLLKSKQDEARELNKEIEEGVFTAGADPKKTFVPPKPEEVPPYLNFAPLENAADALTQSAQHYGKAVEKANANGGAALAGASLSSLNALLVQSERKLTNPGGLPGRAWYKHEIYAPGVYTGYGVKTMPAIRESIEQKKWKLADEGIIEVGRTLAAEAALIDSAAAELEKASK